jgi:uncharacterized membrane protein (DUF373 family)
MTNGRKRQAGNLKESLSLWFGRAEDAIYVGLGILLTAIALSMLVTEMLYFGNYLLTRTLTENAVFLLDRILLIIIIVEVAYTVQVSFRQHVLRPEPFLVVGLIAVTRRIIVLTAEMAKLAKESQEGFYNSMIELGLLTVLTFALVLCVYLLRQREQSQGERS